MRVNAGLTNVGTASVDLPITVNQQIHTFRVGVNYHFNSPGVVAKY